MKITKKQAKEYGLLRKKLAECQKEYNLLSELKNLIDDNVNEWHEGKNDTEIFLLKVLPRMDNRMDEILNESRRLAISLKPVLI